MITLTQAATQQLSHLLAQKADSETAGLRLGIERGGCAGQQYVMKVTEPEEGDEIIEQDGARVIIAADSIELLRGSTIEYTFDLSDSGFKIINPNAARSCGCGTSFEPASEDGSAPEYDPALDGSSCGD